MATRYRAGYPAPMPARALALLLLAGCRLTGPVAQPVSVAARVSVTPWPADAAVTIDQQPGGDLERGPGSAVVRVERPGFRPLQTEVELAEAQHVRLAPRLEGLPVAVRVDSAPAGAEVRIGGEAVGTTPYEGSHAAGDLVVELSLEGWQAEVVERFVDEAVHVEAFLDPPGQLLDRVRLAQTCHRPKAVLIHPEREEIWVACLGGPPSVVAHDLHSGEQVASVDLGCCGAVELHFSQDLTKLYASQMETHQVHEIDVATGKALRSMNAVSLWSKVLEGSVDGEHLYVSNWLGDDVSEIRLDDGVRTRSFPTVVTPRGLYATQDGRSLYVAGFDQGELARIDLISGRSTTLWTAGYAARHLVADEERGRLYLSDMGRDELFVYDLAEGTMRSMVELVRNPNTIDLSDDKEVLFASCRGRSGSGGYLTVGDRGAVFAVDALTGDILDVIAAGRQPTGLDVDGEWLVFSDFRDDRLEIYRIPDTQTLRQGGRTLDDVVPELRLPDPTTARPGDEL